MTYRVKVVELIPLSEEEKKEISDKSRYNNFNPDHVFQEKTREVFIVNLSSEEYEAMKKAIIAIKK